MPHFRIDRLPSGVRYKPKTSIARGYAKERPSSRLPQTHIYSEGAATEPAPGLGESNSTIFYSHVANSGLSAFYATSGLGGGMNDEAPPLSSARAVSASGNSYGYVSDPSTGSQTPFISNQGDSHSVDVSDIPDECLPLFDVNIDVDVDGSIARTGLQQRFSNTSTEAIHQAQYSFPLYDGAVVVSFTCCIGDERELVGEVREKAEAAKLFKKAARKQEAAALLEEHTPEIFEVTLGNIPAETDVRIHVEYLHEIKPSVLDSGEEVLEVVIPMSIAPRYGDLGAYQRGAETKMEREGLNITVKVSESEKVKRLHSNHAVNIERNVPVKMTKVASFAELDEKEAPTMTQSIAKYNSSTAIMDEDFVVYIEHEPVSSIRSRAVLSPPNEAGHAAMMITLKPSEIFKDARRVGEFDGEIILLMDRSGSMGWADHFGWRDRNITGKRPRSKMSTLRKAISISLASLPKNCRFNIISFGDDTQLLWKESQPYTQGSLQEARKYARNFDANMGGTEMLHALETAVNSRRLEETSTQIILVTDGEVEPDHVLSFVWKTRQQLGDKIRFFSLGVGFNVPHRLIHGIGDFGGGYGEVVDIGSKPEWADRLSLMLTAGIMPTTWNCEIDLGPGFERKSLTSYHLQRGPQQGEERSGIVPFFQAPYPTPPLHSFAFRSVFLLFDAHSGDLPTEVKLRAIADKTKNETSHVLVAKSTATDATTVQHLTAKALLLDLEASMGRQSLGRPEEELARNNAVTLGVAYSITSRWTSFVAIEGNETVFDEMDITKAEFIQGNVENFFETELQQDYNTRDDDDNDSNLAVSRRSTRDSTGFKTIEYGGQSMIRHSSSDSRYGHYSAKDDRSVSISTSKRELEVAGSGVLASTPNSKPDGRASGEDPRRWGSSNGSERSTQKTRSSSEDIRSRSHSRQGRSFHRIYRSWDCRVREKLACVRSPMKRSSASKTRDDEDSEDYDSHIDLFDYLVDSRTYSDSESDLEFPGADDAAWKSVSCSKAAESQEAEGLFSMEDTLRERLRSNFVGDTSELILKLLSDSVTSFGSVTAERQQVMVDTLMLVYYFRTKELKNKDLWVMMVEKAVSAVLEALGSTDEDDLLAVYTALELSSKHSYFQYFILQDFQAACPILPLAVSSVCLVCGRGAQHEVGNRKEQESFMDVLKLECAQDGCDFIAEGQESFCCLWKHKVDEGHWHRLRRS